MCNFILEAIKINQKNDAAKANAAVWKKFNDIALVQYQTEKDAKNSPELFAFMTNWLREALRDERFIEIVKETNSEQINLCEFAMKNPSPKMAMDTLDSITSFSNETALKRLSKKHNLKIKKNLILKAMSNEHEIEKIVFLAKVFNLYTNANISYEESLLLVKAINKGDYRISNGKKIVSVKFHSGFIGFEYNGLLWNMLYYC